jgi:RNA polymerase sigma-70 factor, ECF subfamily
MAEAIMITSSTPALTASPPSVPVRAQQMPSSAPSSGHPPFAVLFREHFLGVLDAVQRFGVHPRHAEDVAQDVFVAVFKALERYDPSRPFKPWLKTIAYRTARDSLELGRSQERLTQTGQIDRIESAANPEQQLLATQAQTALNEVLQSLDADHRTIFLMAELDQLTQPEIAQALGIPESTVQSRLRRARVDFDQAAYRRRVVEENRLRSAHVPLSRRSACLNSSRRTL